MQASESDPSVPPAVRVDEPEPGGAEAKAGLSRRQWLLRLGGTVALLGFSGAEEEVQRASAFAASLAGPELPALPPGLYDPLSEHLGHALADDDPFHPIPVGSETDYVRRPSGFFQPRFFSAREFQVVRRVVALMLAEPASAGPRSTGVVDEVAELVDLSVFAAGPMRDAALHLSPEHRLLALHYYGKAAVEEVENNHAQEICREGLAAIEQQAPGGDFLALSEERQVEILKQIGDEPGDKPENAGARFFRLIKAGVIRGFYTSREGLKELDYKGNTFHAEPPGCSHEDGGVRQP